jgi:hypothetical protein
MNFFLCNLTTQRSRYTCRVALGIPSQRSPIQLFLNGPGRVERSRQVSRLVMIDDTAIRLRYQALRPVRNERRRWRCAAAKARPSPSNAGHCAFVGPGVVVVEGAATRSVEPWTVVAGNPSRPIRRGELT